MLNALKYLLAPIALIYGLIVKIRNLMFDYKVLRSVSFEKPIICIGNITVGGTGKTPHVEYLLKLLSTRFNVATLSRGYRRKTKGFGYVTCKSPVTEVGDEPLQIKLKYPQVEVAVDANRVNGISRLINEKPDLDLIILDDAFQHRWVKPGLSILLIDFNQLVFDDYFLPMGRLRDSVKEKRRANIILITKCPKNLTSEQKGSILKKIKLNPNPSIFFTTMCYGNPIPVFNDFIRTLNLKKNTEIIAFAGIANPNPFFSYISSNANIIKKFSFPDHYSFTKYSLSPIYKAYLGNEIAERAIVTTEKDAARLLGIPSLEDDFKKALFYIPIEVKFLDNQEFSFNNQILNYARKD